MDIVGYHMTFDEVCELKPSYGSEKVDVGKCAKYIGGWH